MGLLDFLKRKEAPQLPSAEQPKGELQQNVGYLEEEQSQEELEDEGDSLDLFPGSLNEYIILKREEGVDYSHIIVPMSTGRSDKAVFYNADGHLVQDNIFCDIIENGCIGLIRYDYKTCTGIPVKIKKQPPYR